MSTFRSILLTSKHFSTKLGITQPLKYHNTRYFNSTIAKMGVHNIANKDEFSAALKEHKLTVVDAFATWCGPCKAIAPAVVQFSEEYPDVHFTKIDVDDVPDIAQELGIRVMPTFLIFKGEEKLAEVVGANPKALEAAIKKAVQENA